MHNVIRCRRHKQSALRRHIQKAIKVKMKLNKSNVKKKIIVVSLGKVFYHSGWKYILGILLSVWLGSIHTHEISLLIQRYVNQPQSNINKICIVPFMFSVLTVSPQVIRYPKRLSFSIDDNDCVWFMT